MMVDGQIREHIKSLLANVDRLRDHIVFDTVEIPEDSDRHWISVACGDELIAQLTMGNPTTGAKQEHQLDINIDIVHWNRKGAWLVAEELAEKMIPLLFTDRTLGGLVKSFVAVGKRREKSIDGNPIARLRLQCQTVYQTFDRDPTRSV